MFLSFFHLSSDDLETLLQLTALVRRKHVTLLLPDQVIHEFHRNRDAGSPWIGPLAKLK